MQFIDLKQQYDRIKEGLAPRILGALEAQQFIMGPEVLALEQRLAAYTGRKHCIACANGTDALVLALMAYDIKQGDAVFVPNYTYFASAEAISFLGATPIFVEVGYDFLMDKRDLEDKIQQTKSTGLRLGAILTVDLFGRMLPYSHFLSLAKREGLPLIADVAQAFGAKREGAMAASLGEIATTSFYPAKPFGCYGDGGALFTDSDHLASRLRSLRIHGQGDNRYDNLRIGMNSRLDTLQAIVLDAKLDIFEDELSARQAVADAYSQALKDCCTCPEKGDDERHIWAQYTLLAPSHAKREALRAKGKEAGIPFMVYYDKPMHMQVAYQGFGYKDEDFPLSLDLSQRAISLPMHAYLSDADLRRVVDLVRSVFV